MTIPTAALVRYDDVTSADGTRIRAWTNDGDGPTGRRDPRPDPILSPATEAMRRRADTWLGLRSAGSA